MEYFTFGMKNLRVSQSYNGTVSHKPHWYNSKDYSDYPIDICGKDGGQEGYYATCDMQIVSIKGVGSSVTNTVWLVCLENKITPLGSNIKPFIALTHWNDDDPYMQNRKVGDIVKAGEIICLEGVDGASANHIHLVCGDANRGCGNGFIQNSNGKWVSTGYCYRPEQIMFIDKDFTNVINTSDIKFIEKPTSMYPYTATIKKDSQLYDKNGNTYNKTKTDKQVTVKGEVNGRYEISNQYFNPNTVYCNKGDLK